MNRIRQWTIVFLSLVVFYPLSLSAGNNSIQQSDSSDPEEVYLTFNYQNLFNRVITALYDDGQFYLPVSELFNNLKIPHEVGMSPPTVTGTYLNSDNTFRIDFASFTARIDEKGRFEYNASMMIIGETDFFVTPEILEEVFGLNFSVDFNNLLLNLETDRTMPVLAEANRQQERDQATRFSLRQDYYPLEFDRERKLLAGGFLDYSLSSSINPTNNFYAYNFGIGTEILGGDVQGTASGSYSSNNTNFLTDNLRWRYTIRDNPAVTQIIAGQTSSDGLSRRRFVGVRATNEPIEPRYIYDEIEIQGNVRPDSEVELYFNDALYDYQQVNKNGRYRFLAPLTYGSSRLRLRIYDPSGGVREEERRVQVPFSFQPPGELIYHLNAGRIENPIFGSVEQSNMIQGDVAYGLTNWLTQKVGMEYLDQFSSETPLFYSSTSARINKEYLVNIDAAPTAFYRISSRAVYASSASWDFEYTNFLSNNLYNNLGNDQEFSGNIFLPFSLFEIPLNLRFSGNHSLRNNSSRTRYNVDFNTRIDRLNLRVRYSDIKTGTFNLEPSLSSELSSSATYYIGQSSTLPSFIEGVFLRGQLSYSPRLSDIIQADAQISRNIFDTGRIQASVSRNFRGGFNLFSLGLTIDFNKTRSSSTVRSSQGETAFNQNILGSVGFDSNTNNAILSNRQQVGRAATSVRLFVDNNNSGTFDEGDNVIEDNAIRIGRSGNITSANDGTIYLSQLQAYHRMNLEVNQAAIRNPLLVPRLEQFSIVTDPNQYKLIEIPFYNSGVVSGFVNKTENGEENPVPGLRVYLESEDESYREQMRTYNDGGYYAYEVPPGQYNIYIDEQQLNFLNVRSQPDTIKVEVEALAEGDFKEGLNFTLKSRTETSENTIETATVSDQKKQELTDQELYYQIQLASFKTLQKAEQVTRQAAEQLGGAFSVVKNSNNGLYAIRGASIHDRNQAVETILSYHNSLHSNSALVVLKNRARQIELEEEPHYIQVAAFQSKERAQNFAEKSAEILNSKTAITFNNNSNLYKVYINVNYGSVKNIKLKLAEITQKPSFSDAFISQEKFDQTTSANESDRERSMTFTIQVQIKGTTAESEQTFLASLANDNSDIQLGRPKEEVFVFDDITSWQEALELKGKLQKISTIGAPILVLIENNESSNE